MRRGDIWIATAPGFGRKPRPVLIIQDDCYTATALSSVMVVPLTTADDDAPLLRIPVTPDPSTGLSTQSFGMVDKLVPVRKSNLDAKCGSIKQTDLIRIERALAAILGFAR